MDSRNGFQCRCAPGWSGHQCQTSKLLFILVCVKGNDLICYSVHGFVLLDGNCVKRFLCSLFFYHI